MKLRDLKHGTSSAWPPRWSGFYNPQDTFPQGEVGTLRNAESSAYGRGVRITIEVEGRESSRTMVWDGDRPSPDDIVAALRPHIGTEVAKLGDIDVCPAPVPKSN